MSSNQRYRQFALFSIIVAEVVVNPLALGGGVYWLAQGSSQPILWASFGALAGLGLAFYRISRMSRKIGKDQDRESNR